MDGAARLRRGRVGLCPESVALRGFAAEGSGFARKVWRCAASPRKGRASPGKCARWRRVSVVSFASHECSAFAGMVGAAFGPRHDAKPIPREARAFRGGVSRREPSRCAAPHIPPAQRVHSSRVGGTFRARREHSAAASADASLRPAQRDTFLDQRGAIICQPTWSGRTPNPCPDR